jgi:hypothetical protein
MEGTMDEMMPPIGKVAALKALREQFTGVDATTQCCLLLAALRLHPITTFEASRYLDVYHPAGRIKDLRDDGHKITTIWTITETEAGVRHRVGRYLLLREAGQEVEA